MMEVKSVLEKLNLSGASAVPFSSEEDGNLYDVYKIQFDDQTFVLKKTSQREVDVYQKLLNGFSCVPQLIQVLHEKDEVFMLMSYEKGHSLCRCTREHLKLTLDALIELQRKYWNTKISETGWKYRDCLQSRRKRTETMKDLKDVYLAYLNEFERIPKTLTHDDLLPFNVLCFEEKAVLIDWNDAGILPYATSLARLIAYGEEDSEALFQMSAQDKQFALNYYYEHFIHEMGIDRDEYDTTMDLFLFKEYSEWIYCAEISQDDDMEYYKKYAPKALLYAEKYRNRMKEE